MPGTTEIETIDAHTAGEPFRVITAGLPEIPGADMLAKRRWARERLDGLRRALMWEPRGHADMYGCILTEPVSDGADFGVLFLHNEGFSTMCGHGIIGVATVVLECGLREAREPETTLRIDTPAGPVVATAAVGEGRVRSVRFRNVPSFVLARGERIDVPGIGELVYDLAFGGAFYAYVDAAAAGVRCDAGGYRDCIERGLAIKRAIAAARPIEHPFEEDLGFLYGVVFVAPPHDPAHHSRNVCVFADGEVDRSPTGTSVSARLALHHAAGELPPGEWIVVESLLGTTFRGRVARATTCGPHPAVVPEVEGSAWLTGRHTFLIRPDDPLRDGFLLR